MESTVPVLVIVVLLVLLLLAVVAVGMVEIEIRCGDKIVAMMDFKSIMVAFKRIAASNLAYNETESQRRS